MGQRARPRRPPAQPYKTDVEKALWQRGMLYSAAEANPKWFTPPTQAQCGGLQSLQRQSRARTATKSHPKWWVYIHIYMYTHTYTIQYNTHHMKFYVGLHAADKLYTEKRSSFVKQSLQICSSLPSPSEAHLSLNSLTSLATI